MTKFRLTLPIATVLCLSAVISATALFSSITNAQAEVESITLSPATKDYEVKPGEIVRDKITVLNDGTTAYNFTVYATPYSVTNELYDPNFTDISPRSDAYTWIQFEKTTYRAEPRETVEIPFTVQVKADAMPGGHYGAIFVETEPGANEQLARKKRVGAIVYATVDGDVVREGEVKSVSVPWFQTRAPLSVSADILNTGNTDFQAVAAYEIKDIFGRVLYKAEQPYAVLPDTTRRIQLEWTNAGWFGLYHVDISVSAMDSTKTASSYVLLTPTWLIILITVALLGGGVHALVRRMRRKKR